MKKLLFIVALAGLMLGCSCGNRVTKEAEKLAAQAEVLTGDAAHNAQNSLDYMGIYRGVVATDDGKSVAVTVVLSENTYTKSTLAEGEPDAANVVESGAYSWNDKGNTVTLEGAAAPNQYFVGENNLTQQNKEGGRMSADLADKYRLTKVE